jgi:hypothetical protein
MRDFVSWFKVLLIVVVLLILLVSLAVIGGGGNAPIIFSESTHQIVTHQTVTPEPSYTVIPTDTPVPTFTLTLTSTILPTETATAILPNRFVIIDDRTGLQLYFSPLPPNCDGIIGCPGLRVCPLNEGFVDTDQCQKSTPWWWWPWAPIGIIGLIIFIMIICIVLVSVLQVNRDMKKRFNQRTWINPLLIQADLVNPKKVFDLNRTGSLIVFIRELKGHGNLQQDFQKFLQQTDLGVELNHAQALEIALTKLSQNNPSLAMKISKLGDLK